MNIFFDLDGPILDVSEKYYRVYADLVLEKGGHPIPKSEYWEAKRQRIPDQEILGRSHLSEWTQEFRSFRKACIETADYLKYDRLWPNMMDILAQLSNDFPLFLVTLRTSRTALLWQLDNLQISAYFTEILSRSGDSNPQDKPSIKIDLIHQSFNGTHAIKGWFIGDTETDIRAGQALGLGTVAVTFGIRTHEQLLLTKPDILLREPQSLAHWLRQHKFAR